MADRIGVLKFPVRVSPVGGNARLQLRKRLDVMEREAQHLVTAIKDMKNGLDRSDNRLLTSGVMNSRNWTLSLVMSHCYVQNLLGEGSNGSSGFPGMLSPSASYQSLVLFERAAKAGTEDGYRDRTT